MNNGYILYEGKSKLDNKPIVAIATGFLDKSLNTKTGGLIQTYIIRSDVPPHMALKTGDDSSVCGNCKHRSINNGACYVQVYWAPLSVYNAYKRGIYTLASKNQARLLGKNQGIRLGSYGDPAAVPISIWNNFISEAKFHLGYTHQWKTCSTSFSKLCMASVDTAEEAFLAQQKGYRYFRIKKPDEEIFNKEVVCPASHEKGKILTCVECKACDGTSNNKKSNIVLLVHGAKKNRFINNNRN